MITAQEAKKNVEAYETALFHKTNNCVMAQLEDMGKSIEFHSQNGIRQLTFSPYDKSLFPSYEMLDMARNIFDTILKQNGYNVVENDCRNNFLKVQW